MTSETSASPQMPSNERADAASVIQKNYRGYRSRRQLNGLNMDAASRWAEIVREAQYQHLITPRPRSSYTESYHHPSNDSTSSNFAQAQWYKAKKITEWAHDEDSASDTLSDTDMTPIELESHRRAKSSRRERRQLAKDMGLNYWLEMVDKKHRYGSHLRSYHAVWQKAETNENFFQWLDHGPGLSVDTEKCSREVLDRDRVRYLTREQRAQYLVCFDEDGRLRWAKNGERVETSEEFVDDGTGIVRRPPGEMPEKGEKSISKVAKLKEKLHIRKDKDDETESSVASADESSDEEDRAKTTVPPAAIFDHLRHSSGNAKKKPKWIFVADTSFRLYIGMKMSGSFQHSSFLHGARIFAAGQIRIKDGQIRKISPLSGHYRPPVANFRAFIRSLKDEGADLSRLILPHSYAVLIGVDSWKKAESHSQTEMGKLEHKMNKVFRPEKARRREEAEMDGSESARREAEFLAQEKEAQDKERRGNLREKIRI